MTVEKWLAALEVRVRATGDQPAIVHLLTTYGPAVDCGEGWPAAGLWTDSGVYDVSDVSRAEGREEMAALYDADCHRGLIHAGPAHVAVPMQITVIGDRAVAVGHSIVCRRGENGYNPRQVSANCWTLVRTEDGWRIAERFNRLLDGSPEACETVRTAAR